MMLFSKTFSPLRVWRINSQLTKYLSFSILAVSLSGCLSVSELESDFAPSTNPQTVDTVQQNDERAKLGAQQHPRIVESYGGEYQNVGTSRMMARIVGILTTVSENPLQS